MYYEDKYSYWILNTETMTTFSSELNVNVNEADVYGDAATVTLLARSKSLIYYIQA